MRTLPAFKEYDGTTETNTLHGVIRGTEMVGSGTTYGFKYWREGAGADDTLFVAATPDSDGHITTVLTDLTEGTTYHYAACIDNGTKKQCDQTLDITTVRVVDLGLSVKWANVNLGAESEGAGGDFYRWGATVPYRSVTQQSQSDKDLTPQSGFDIAANLWGLGYRMPTRDEYLELIANTTRKWVIHNGYTGYMFFSAKEGYNDSIFIPAAGYYYDSYHNALNANADYWTSTANGSGSAYDLNFANNAMAGDGGVPSHGKHHGFSVRAVQERLAYLCTGDVIRNTKGAQEVDTLTAFVATVSGSPITVGFEYSLNSNMKDSVRVAIGTASRGYYKYVPTGLLPGKTYYYRAYATDGTTTRYGKVLDFGLVGAVDLGLPSGTLWATANLGASKPEDCGDYYAWGETEPKTYYNASTYKFGTTENIGNDYDIAGSKYDAAHMELGNAWRMPTKAQMEELLSADSCTWTHTTFNGMSGYVVKSKHNGDSIFLPDAGVMHEDNPVSKGTGAVYLTSNHQGDGSQYTYVLSWHIGNGYSAGIRSGSSYWPIGGDGSSTYRYWGRVIRSVYKPSSSTPDGVSINILTDSASWKLDDTSARLYGTFSTSKVVNGGYNVGFVIGDSSTIVRERCMREYVETVSDGCEFSTTQIVAGNLGYWYRSFVTVGDTTYYGEAKHFGIEMVDMGVSVKWANVNVGAQQPEEYGDYFAWGETVPKTTFTSDNYAFGTTQNLGNDYDIAGSAMDAAAMNMGGGWRMPTSTEMQELLSACDVAWVLQNGVKGYRFTSRKTKNTLFFPAAGAYYDNSSTPNRMGNGGAYHTSTQGGDERNASYAYAMSFSKNNGYAPGLHTGSSYWPLGGDGTSTYRWWGRTVRAVFDPNVVTPSSDMMHIVADSAHWKLGDTSATLYATFNNVTPVDNGVIIGIVAGDSVTVTRGNGKHQTEKTVTGADHVVLTNVPVIDNFGYWYKAYVVVDGQVYYSEPRHFGLELIDLGLTSRLLWANMNVGASRPVDYGDYYAWGETDNTKTSFTSVNYTHGTTIINAGTTSEGNISGDAQYDAARKNMAGTYWRTPTSTEMQELLNNCTWTWVLRDGVKGYLGTSKNNGKTIFLPAAGYRTDAENPNHLGFGASYWTANQMTGNNQASYVYVMAYHYKNGYAPGIHSDRSYWPLGGDGTSTYRYYGRSVRAVGYRNQ